MAQIELRRRLSVLLVSATALCAAGPAPAAAQQPAAGEPLQFVSLTAGSQFTCGLTGSGAAYCWGENGFGELGFASPEDCRLEHRRGPCSTYPRPVDGGLVFTDLDTSMGDVCGLVASGGRIHRKDAKTQRTRGAVRGRRPTRTVY